MRRLAILAVLASACTNGIDPRWQILHHRIIAVRVTPPHLVAGATGAIDALVTSPETGALEETPTLAIVAPATPATAPVPLGLANAIMPDGHGGYQVTAPDAATLDAARVQLGLGPTDPIPLDIGATFASGDQQLAAFKQVFLGDAADNPTLDAVTIGGAAPVSPISVPFDTDVTLSIAADPTFQINWLTSCGSMNADDDEATAILHVNPDDSLVGELVVVERDPNGGVTWQAWDIASTAPPTP